MYAGQKKLVFRRVSNRVYSEANKILVLFFQMTLKMLAHTDNRQICDANACYSRVFFSYEVLNEVLNAVLYLSEHSDQLDVTLESSKIVKLAAQWLSPGFGRPETMLSNEDHGIYSDFFLLSCLSSPSLSL